ncbi:unnamed protein product [Microthlaspi erraticum]|uniref:Uncharacterized protein n=1 Tax=Microthlaspi erraticum TaxID=1685480 RepID=A0A6D2JUS2_9BRAS|nr:unnamed protein product [Microthlaspi erraticum]CAA7054008.1 unnamed protein product [Microthlaspi erraticum]
MELDEDDAANTVGDEFDLEDDIENSKGPQQRPPLLQHSCYELHQEVPICICPTLGQAAKAVTSQGQLHAPRQDERTPIYKKLVGLEGNLLGF